MAEGKNSIIFYRDWKEIFESLEDKDCAELIRHIFKYVNDENPETKNPIVNAVFIPIKLILKRDLKKWKSICDRNKINGSKGGRPKNPEEPKKPSGLSGNPEEPKKPDIDIDIDNENIFIYNEFYDFQISISNGDSNYLKLVKILFGDNEDKKILKGVLSIREQLTYQEFLGCLEYAKKYDKKISDSLLKIDNDKKYYKGKTSLNRTLKNWLSNKFVK